MNENIIIRKLSLNAQTSEVWNALITPSETKKYMFNCEAHSDWQVGSEITWKGNFQGYESGERGEILEIETNKRLKYSSIDPNFGIEIKPENYLHISYNLDEKDEKTILTTTIENFNGDPKRLEHAAKGWDNFVLPGIENLFNKSQPIL
ncbi:SRPBCC family protein [Sphingobacterium sp. LRF_L2]|uniref:SRPBCC family protein n=1 Tax=Sphingobacterium sp. LRF_L2 TaxID=3369421 RepID=UPI003F630294